MSAEPFKHVMQITPNGRTDPQYTQVHVRCDSKNHQDIVVWALTPLSNEVIPESFFSDPDTCDIVEICFMNNIVGIAKNHIDFHNQGFEIIAAELRRRYKQSTL